MDDSDDWRARLHALRGEIDAADRELLRLLSRRADLSLEVGRVKARMSETGSPGSIFNPQRERQVLDNLASWNTGALPRQHLENIWREIFSSSRALQRPLRVAYLGPEGSFSHHAALDFLGASLDFTAQADLPEVFRAVQEQRCDMGIAPLENSLQGSVGQVLDLFLEYELDIQAELYYRINHSLLSRERSPATVRTVYSHSQPLAQCGAWLRANLPQAALVPLESTAAAARRAAQEPGTAAIAHRNLADPLHLHLLSTRIQDAPNNWTRFAIISRLPVLPVQQAKDAREETISSLLFTLPDKAGALAAVLNVLALAEVNMRKLESRPLRTGNWKYAFFADLECNLKDPRLAPMVANLRGLCMHCRILGVYPAGPRLDRPEEDLHA
ncbi:MAG: prephenate dehydratase [Deltaproteobacteria bacterium]|jgi:chorismate mutase/prephenate dehydratase|nr:prephenate dehydratase [Deltaproteobacteria bacterium]